MSLLLEEIRKKFGPSESSVLSNNILNQLQLDAFYGQIILPSIRSLYWRLFLNIISINSQNNWINDFKLIKNDYEVLKQNAIPKTSEVKVDPLSALLGEKNEEWDNYYKSAELASFIKGDLERLYVTGIDDEYFEIKRRRDILLNVLLVWSLQHSYISYRQGMHEISGLILFSLECEFNAWNEGLINGTILINSHPLAIVYNDKNSMDSFLEAHCYCIFNKIMVHLEPLYDPKNGADGVPGIVQFCSKIQEHYLRQYDSKLCDILEERSIQSHLYGMKWTRLLFSREFPMTNHQGFKVWDYIFSYCLITTNSNLQPSDIVSEISNINTSKEALLSKSRYGPHSLLLAGISDVMIAMLLAIRQELIDSDDSMCLAYLMRYPQPLPDEDTESTMQNLLNTANKIRTGTLIRNQYVKLTNNSNNNITTDRRSVNGRRKSFNQQNQNKFNNINNINNINNYSNNSNNSININNNDNTLSTDDKNAIDLLLPNNNTNNVLSNNNNNNNNNNNTLNTFLNKTTTKHKEMVDSWLNSAPSIPLFLVDSIEAGKRAASSVLFSTNVTHSNTNNVNNTNINNNIQLNSKKKINNANNNSNNSNNNSTTIESDNELNSEEENDYQINKNNTEQLNQPKMRKRDYIKSLIMPNKSNNNNNNNNNNQSLKNIDHANLEQEFSLQNTSIAMVSQNHPQNISLQNKLDSLSITNQSVQQINYDTLSTAELVEDRLRTLADLLRSCPNINEITNNTHKKTYTHSTITTNFIADKIELLSDVLGGLYSIPEYDKTFMTLVSDSTNSIKDNDIHCNNNNNNNNKVSILNDPFGISSTTIPTTKKTVLIGNNK